MQFKYSVCLSGILVSLGVLLLYSYDNPELWVKVILEYLSEPRDIQLFRLDAGWPRDPDHFTGVPFDIAVDYQSSLVYVAQRGDNVSKVLVFTEEGVFKDSWNTDTLEMPHGIFAAITPKESSLWITDVGQGNFGHTVKQYTMSGKLIKVLGTAGLAGSGLSPLQFDQPADVFVKPNGDMYIVDGDGGLNNRLLMLNRDFNVQWALGGNGTQPGKFYIPHSVEVDEFGRVWVADRGNKRIQVFDSVTGEWIGTWDTCFSEDGPYSVRKSGLPKTLSSSEPAEMTGECLQLQQELDTLRQVHASIHALNEMTINLHKTLQLVVKNSHDLKGLNEGWQIFFGQKRRPHQNQSPFN